MLVDTSVWIAHLRQGLPDLESHLLIGAVLCHPFIVGELACGNLKNRGEILSRLRRLPRVLVAGDEEVLKLIEDRRLMGRGISWIDAHLLASTLVAGAELWTLDRRLEAVARPLGVLWSA
jgi:predicted nucleic acid-binding protein